MAPITNKMYSPSRAPMEKSAGGVTIAEIEREVDRLHPGVAVSDLREKAFLFAILKAGTSRQKLQWFTHYSMEFVGARLDALREQTWTGSLSTQYVLSQVPGSEDLIERITGQRIVPPTITPKARQGYDWQKNLNTSPAHPKAQETAIPEKVEEPTVNTQINGAAEIAEIEPAVTCLKTLGCDRPAGHNGICKGQKVPRRNTQRAAAVKAKAPRTKPARAAKAARNGNVPGEVSRDELTPRDRGRLEAAAKDPGHFKIEFEDKTETISLEGMGRDSFARNLKMLYESFAGVANA